MGRKTVTILDVTKLARVSASTVSTVLNKTDKYVSPELRRRVLEAVRKLNYRPNLVARSLKLEKTKSIGLIFPNILSPVMPPLVHTFQRISQQAGFDTFVSITEDDADKERAAINTMLAKRVDGLVISPVMHANYELLLYADSTIPVVLIERCIPGMECVITNNLETSYKATRHLIEHGRTHIGLITMKSYGTNTQERIEGYTRAVKDIGLFDETLIRETDFAGSTATEVTRQLLTSRTVDAILATSQSISLGAFMAIKQLGKKIPEDVALFGYDDVPWMEAVTPALSTARQPIANIASKACEALFARLGGKPAHSHTLVIDSELVVRQSCGCEEHKCVNFK
jgi:DNA-binding LacI/PurR family transcriptional regulator